MFATRFALFLATLGLLATTALANRVTEDDLRPHIEILASDAFEGREPGTEGEKKTIDYITASWAKAGLKPGVSDGSWLDPVPLVRRQPQSATYSFYAHGEKLRFASEDITLSGIDAEYKATRLPLIYVGYGVGSDGKVAADVSGKIALMLMDSADFVPSAFRSPRARRDALAAAGASGVIAIADEQIDYAAIRRVLRSRPIGLAAQEKRAPLEGAVSTKFAVALVTAAGRDWDKLRAASRAADYKGEVLGISGDFDVVTDVNRFDSYNVIGKIPGRKKGSGAVLFMGHWDHLGICRPDGEDKICNGAVDNASGIAALTEVARQLSRKKHDRDIYFVATTAEESGLLGASDFASDPAVPLTDIVAVLNLDTIAIAPRGAKVTIVGRGTTSLDPIIESVAKKLGRGIESSSAANAFLQRQDGWVLTQKGVPALMVGGSFADPAILQSFLSSDYHGPDDELGPNTDLGGAAEDATLHIELGRHFADAKKFKPKKTGG